MARRIAIQLPASNGNRKADANGIKHFTRFDAAELMIRVLGIGNPLVEPVVVRVQDSDRF